MTYTFRVRSFVLDGEQKSYSEWSPVITCLPQPRVSLLTVKGGKLQIKWRKVPLATGYAVYISGRRRGGYRKMITVSGKKRSVTLRKFRGKKFNAKKKYYVYVVALKKVNGLMNTSGALYFWSNQNRNVGYLG